jgi:hypothetical protein
MQYARDLDRSQADEEELVRFLRACFQADDTDPPEGGTP